MTSKPRYQLGFTLIELMVVVAIVGVLMAAGIVAFSGAQRNSRDAKRRSDIDAIAKAMEQDYQNTGRYYLVGRPFPTITTGWNDAYQLTNLQAFFPERRLPTDPINQPPYYYTMASINNTWSTGNPPRFCVAARLETANGNCTGQSYPEPYAGDINVPAFGRCSYVTPGTGTHYCASNRQ